MSTATARLLEQFEQLPTDDQRTAAALKMSSLRERAGQEKTAAR